MKLGNIFFTVIIVTVIAASGICEDFYVDAVNGSNDNDGRAPEQAWRTITYALNQLVVYSFPITLNVTPGTYDMALGETFPIELISGLTFRGADRDTTIIDATGSGVSAIACFQSEDIVIEGFTITGGSGNLLENPQGIMLHVGGGILCAVGTLLQFRCGE